MRLRSGGTEGLVAEKLEVINCVLLLFESPIAGHLLFLYFYSTFFRRT